MKVRPIRREHPGFVVFAALLLACAPLSVSASPNLTPTRSSIEQSGYTLDFVGDKKQKDDTETITVIIRVTHGNKVPIKPDSVYLVDASGKKYDADDRDDRTVGHEENSGLPLLVSPSADTNGNASLGLGVNLNSLFGPHGTYSYSKVQFLRKDFISGRKLKIVLENGKVFTVSLTSITE